MNMC